MKISNLLFLLPFLLVAVSGCNEKSNHIRTSQLQAHFFVDAGRDRVDVRAHLTRSSVPAAIVLGSNDMLVLSRDGSDALLWAYTAGSPFYRYFLPPVENDSEVRISFVRNDRVDAPDSFVVVPAPFSVQYPEANSYISRNEDITFIWTPVGSHWFMDIKVDFDCDDVAAKASFRINAGAGTITFHPEEYYPEKILQHTDLCRSEVSFEIHSKGVVDGNFSGGQFDAVQQRVLAFWFL